MGFSDWVTYFVSLLVICSPWAGIPFLLSLTHGHTIAEKKQTGLIASFAVAIILIVMTWIGTPLLAGLGIRVASFQVTGGIVIFLLALSMLRAETSPIKENLEDKKEAARKHSVAIVPLAIPFLAGPGAISTVIVVASDFPKITDKIYMSFCAVAVSIVIAAFLYFASSIEKALGPTKINIISRISGLILAALAVESMAKGLIGLFPHLKG